VVEPSSHPRETARIAPDIGRHVVERLLEHLTEIDRRLTELRGYL
jgi:hypothetical protein